MNFKILIQLMKDNLDNPKTSKADKKKLRNFLDANRKQIEEQLNAKI